MLSALAWYIIGRENSSSIKREIRTFAIPDTAQIGAVFIADREGNMATIKRVSNGNWILNDMFKCRNDKVDMLLKTFNRVRVKRPVAVSIKEQVLKSLSTTGKKVEVYDLDLKPIQTYYIGGADQKTTGTYMMIEGSSEPFVTHIRGWNGYLSTRFFTKESEWRDRAIVSVSRENLKSIIMDYRHTPENSIKIEAQGGELTLTCFYKPERAKGVNKDKVLEYVNHFKRVIAEGFETGADYQDSILNQVTPFANLTVTTKNQQDRTVFFYERGNYTIEGEYSGENDNDRFFFYCPETKDFGVVQEYATTGKIMKPFSWFY